jgi:hypothetical protein
MPERKGLNPPDLGSRRCSSPRKVLPTTKSFLPSLLGRGMNKLSGLEVNWIGLTVDWRRNSLLSGSAQICLCDRKTKYFPSAVHFPQHSARGLCHPVNNRCRSVVPAPKLPRVNFLWSWNLLPFRANLFRRRRKCSSAKFSRPHTTEDFPVLSDNPRRRS